MSNIRHFTATGFVVDSNAILLHWHPKVLAWLPPGGHIESNEDPAQTVLREVFEETGLKVEILNTRERLDFDDPIQIEPPFIIMLETLQEGCDWLNTNKYFAGLMIVLLNIGSKYNTIELSKSQQNFFKSDKFRYILIFAMLWSATRDIKTSLVLTVFVHVFTAYLFNENCKMCIIPKTWRDEKTVLDINKMITQQEINNAVITLRTAKQQERFRR